jgi:hypothetical protein
MGYALVLYFVNIQGAGSSYDPRRTAVGVVGPHIVGVGAYRRLPGYEESKCVYYRVCLGNSRSTAVCPVW